MGEPGVDADQISNWSLHKNSKKAHAKALSRKGKRNLFAPLRELLTASLMWRVFVQSHQLSPRLFYF
jgi:hypothetical protein